MLDHARRINAGRESVDIRYAPPGVDTEVFHPAPYREPQAGPVLCVGRLDDPRKNIGLLLEAYARLPQMLQERHPLLLAGAGAPNEDFWRRAHALGLQDRIRFIHRPTLGELVALYQQASVFALSSDEEGLGVVVLEAMSCGVPVVCTRCGGPDGIITDGVDGRLVPLGDAEAMAASLSELQSDSAANVAMGRAARATIERRYALDVAGKAFVDVWNRLLDKRSKTCAA
jgi:glycosyltransferase involved in cell wall biosynthesis